MWVWTSPRKKQRSVLSMARASACGRVRVGSTPGAMAEVVRTKAPLAVKVAMETGPLAVWHWHELKAAGVPIVCIHARHAKAALSMQINKTDANDAFGLAQIVRTGWYRPVDVKSMDSHKLRLLVAARTRLVSMRTALYSQIRGLLKTFGVVLPPGKGGSLIRPPLAAKVHRGIAGIIRRWLLIVLRLKTLRPGPGLQQGAVHRKMLVRGQASALAPPRAPGTPWPRRPPAGGRDFW